MKIFGLACLLVLSLFANVEEAREKLLLQLSGEWVSRGLYVVNKLNIAELLNEGPKTTEELAKLAECDPYYLDRLMHMLASNGIFEELAPHYYGNSESSALLSSNHSSSLKSIAEFYGEEIHNSWDALLPCVQKGQTAFNLVYKQPVFAYFKANPERMQLFQKAMREKSKAVIESSIEVYPFQKYERVYDIGGGNGAFLRALATKYPEMKGYLFELPEVIATLKKDKFELVAGDFFSTIPTGGDLYFMKSVIHDWNDEKSIEILKNCHAAMKPGSKLLIIDTILLPKEGSVYANSMDILMMAIAGGKERFYSDFESLLNKAGFKIDNIYKTSTEFSLIEATKL